jgi:hypothetical protein
MTSTKTPARSKSRSTSGGNFENLVPSTVPAVTEVTDTIDTSTVKLTADTSVAEGGTVTYTATVGAPVTGSPVVTLANGQTITIEVGKTTGTVTTTAPNDALNGHEPLTNSITGVSGGNYENLVADKTPVRPPSPTPSTPPTCRSAPPVPSPKAVDRLHRDPDQRCRLAGHRDPVQRRGDHHRSRQNHRHRDRSGASR